MFYKWAQVKISVGQRWFLVPLTGSQETGWEPETGHGTEIRNFCGNWIFFILLLAGKHILCVHTEGHCARAELLLHWDTVYHKCLTFCPFILFLWRKKCLWERIHLTQGLQPMKPEHPWADWGWGSWSGRNVLLLLAQLFFLIWSNTQGREVGAKEMVRTSCLYLVLNRKQFLHPWFLSHFIWAILSECYAQAIFREW